jgi:hypothetical protein
MAPHPLNPTDEQMQVRANVIRHILTATRENLTIKLPDFDASMSIRSDVAFQTIGVEPNNFGGTIGDYRYQFEGEEDLLHLIVSRIDFGEIDPSEGQAVCEWLLPWVPVALMWFKPGKVTQHFYVGHDELLKNAPS